MACSKTLCRSPWQGTQQGCAGPATATRDEAFFCCAAKSGQLSLPQPDRACLALALGLFEHSNSEAEESSPCRYQRVEGSPWEKGLAALHFLQPFPEQLCLLPQNHYRHPGTATSEGAHPVQPGSHKQ